MRPPDRDDAADHRRAIADVVAQLPAPYAELGATVGAAATRAASALDACDAELAWLEPHAGAVAIDRLSAQLGAMESASTTSPETEELTQLLQRELDVVRRMGARMNSLGQRRAHILTLLRGLWRHVSIVRDAEDSATPALASAVADLRILCREIDTLLDADA